MSIHVWACRCGRRWYFFERSEWDSCSAETTWCPGCNPNKDAPTGWSEL